MKPESKNKRPSRYLALLVRLWRSVTGQRKARLEQLRQIRRIKEIDRLEKRLEDLMLSLPHGAERRACNNDLFMVRTMRAMKGI